MPAAERWFTPATDSALVGAYEEGLRIYHVNDVHSRLTPHDYDITGTNDVPMLEQVGGAACMATKMLELKAEHPGALILDAGDVSEGSVLGDLGYNRGLIDFYNMLDQKLKAQGGRGIDAAVVGNHDVRHISMISNMLYRAEFPFISMNIVYNGTTDRVFPPYVTVVSDGKKVGILGYTTDTSSHLEETTENVLDVRTCSWNDSGTDIQIKDYVDELRNDENCDVVVLLMHVGHSRVASDADGAWQLVEDDGETEPPDVAIAGHWHTLTETAWQPSDINHKLIIAEAASYMQYIGELNLTDDGGYVDAEKHVIRCADITPDPDVEAYLDTLKAEYAANPNTHCNDTNITYALDQVIGYSADELRLNKDKWFTHSEYPWAGDNNSGAWVADSMQWYVNSQPGLQCDIALQSGGGVRRDNAAGAITYLELYETYPWVDDTMILMQVTGQKIRDFISEDNCGTSISQGWEIYADDGVIYNMKYNGEDLDPTANYWVCVSKYMYDHDNDLSSGGWGGASETEIDYSIRQSMVDYTSQFTEADPMEISGPRYIMNTDSAGRFRAVVTMVDDENTEPYYESAFIRLLSATPDTVERRGGYVDENLVNEDGSINATNQLTEVMLYRSYLGFEAGALTNGMIIDVEGEFGFYAGNPQFVDQNGIVADGVEFRIVDTDPSLALPDYKTCIEEFWDEWHENHYICFEGIKVSDTQVKDRTGRTITVYDEGGYYTATLPGSAGDHLKLSGVQTYRYTERRFRCGTAVVMESAPDEVDYSPFSSVVNVEPGVQSTFPLMLEASASDSTEESFMQLLPCDDTQVADGHTNYTFGTSTTLYLQSAADGYGNERIWTMFDLSGLDAGTSIESATLRMYCWDNYYAASDMAVDVHGCTDDSWDEDSLMWATQPELGSVVASATLDSSEEAVWHEWDVTGFVSAEAAGDGIASLAIKPSVESAESRNAFKYDSKEYNDGAVGPFLEIEFSNGTVVGGTVVNLAFYYRYSADGLEWGNWTLAGNVTAEPWSLSFSYPDGYGFYEFYSVATDDTGNVEPAPTLADARVEYVEDFAASGFELWMEEHGLSGSAPALMGLDYNSNGVANAFEYAFGTNLTESPLIVVKVVNGKIVIETPAQDGSTLPYVDISVQGSTTLSNWTLPVASTNGAPSGRAWYTPKGQPANAFFRLEAELSD